MTENPQFGAGELTGHTKEDAFTMYAESVAERQLTPSQWFSELMLAPEKHFIDTTSYHTKRKFISHKSKPNVRERIEYGTLGSKMLSGSWPVRPLRMGIDNALSFKLPGTDGYDSKYDVLMVPYVHLTQDELGKPLVTRVTFTLFSRRHVEVIKQAMERKLEDPETEEKLRSDFIDQVYYSEDYEEEY